MALRIGIVGHRPDPAKRRVLIEADIRRLRATLRAILQHIAEAFEAVGRTHEAIFDCPATHENNRRGTLRVVSAIAEGGDQWGTQEAVTLGYELQAVLPFAAQEYLNDFAPGSPPASAFGEMLDEATAVLVADGDRSEADAAHEAAGRLVLNQYDLLVAIWDGTQRAVLRAGGDSPLTRSQQVRLGVSSLRSLSRSFCF